MPTGLVSIDSSSDHEKKSQPYGRFGLQIEDYFQQLQDLVSECAAIQSHRLTTDKRSTHEGFISGELYFADDSVLHLREFVDVELLVERLLYVYQYMTASGHLIFRYDNTGHHKKLNLPTYPHHKHERSETNILPSPAPELAAVLSEIETLIDYT